MGAGVHDAFPPPMCVVVFIHLRMETPLRGRSGGHTGTAPTLSFGWIARGRLVSLGWIAGGRLMLFGWIACGWFCLLVGENGAHEPTPSVLYFCQPRVADNRRLPWGKS